MQLAEVHQAQKEAPSSQQQAQAKQQSSPAKIAMNKHLPKTASPLPLIALTGILSLAGALALRFFSKRVA
ncbi:MAG: hypothetical protein DMG09_28575 [Acidobacteria bacterium]|nr:MAG: hypothetical protein DMG09_28575 [Acidobacteriota bacterium]